MSRKSFLVQNGATCNNWRNSWAFINEMGKAIIFGEWDKNYEKENDRTLILDETKYINGIKKKKIGYKEALGYLKLVKENGYSLYTFPMKYGNEKKDGSGNSKIKKFDPILTKKKLHYDNGKWYVSNIEKLAEEVDIENIYSEGMIKKIYINAYERNSKARKACIDYYGASCCVCGFNFQKVYGAIGKDYIHVHHIVPISTIKKEYDIDPIKDLRPICPNCHSMIHKNDKPFTIEELKKYLTTASTL